MDSAMEYGHDRQIRSYRFSAEATAMILSDVFERFSRDSPLSVMAQGIMENALNPQILDQLFEDVAEKQFTHKLEWGLSQFGVNCRRGC